MRILKVGIVAALVIGAMAGGALLSTRLGFFAAPAAVSTVVESRSSQVITAVEREEQVVLLSLGIQGYEKIESHGQIWGFSVPASGKSAFLPYSFVAKLGVEGKDVTIVETGENEFLVSVPQFVFIGHDEIFFDDMIEVGGVLSGTAEKINQSEVSNRILSAEHQSEYVANYTEVLEQQARAFFTNIVTSIDPSARLVFEFSDSAQ